MSNFPKRKSESPTTTKMHYAVSYFSQKWTPPKTHTTSPPFPGKEVLSHPLSEPSFPVVKKLIQKVLVALRNGDPQIGHFTLDTLIYAHVSWSMPCIRAFPYICTYYHV